MAWLDFDSLVNARDVGGIPTRDGGRIAEGRLIRSDHLQALTDADVERLVAMGVTDVVDLRSSLEVEDSPLSRVPGITVHRHSYVLEHQPADDVIEDAIPTAVEEDPWSKPLTDEERDKLVGDSYLGYTVHRPESVVGALRAIADAEGTVLVHCAAGKDRTGMTVAFALLLAGADPDDVVADYALSSQRVERVIEKLIRDPRYHGLIGQPMSNHVSAPGVMRRVLAEIEERHGGVEQLLESIGWTAEDTAKLRERLLA